MTAEVIEGTAVEIVPEVRAVAVVQQPGQSLVAQSKDPADMVAVATRLADVLKDIVERQRLYDTISGKKFPRVEAWMTIGRLDNVVAREADAPIRRDDGSYEAWAELVRLSDGMVIGRASALCGTPDDKPWNNRSEPARRAMAATRATSRAFRQQYSWIMALAGYEPTPAEEMPHTPAPGTPPPASSAPVAAPPGDGGNLWHGPVSKGQAPVDGLLRQTPDGSAFGFVITDDRGKRVQVLAIGPLADALAIACSDGLPAEATVDGDLELIPWDKKQPDGTTKAMPPFRRVIALRVETPEWVIPHGFGTEAAPSAQPTEDGKYADLDSLPF